LVPSAQLARAHAPRSQSELAQSLPALQGVPAGQPGDSIRSTQDAAGEVGGSTAAGSFGAGMLGPGALDVLMLEGSEPERLFVASAGWLPVSSCTSGKRQLVATAQARHSTPNAPSVRAARPRTRARRITSTPDVKSRTHGAYQSLDAVRAFDGLSAVLSRSPSRRPIGAIPPHNRLPATRATSWRHRRGAAHATSDSRLCGQ
jgi:hypothetical protein